MLQEMVERGETLQRTRLTSLLFLTSLLAASSEARANEDFCLKWLAVPLHERTLGVNVKDGLNDEELARLEDIKTCALNKGTLGKIHGTAHLMGNALWNFDNLHGRDAHGSDEFGMIVDDLYEGWQARRREERESTPDS